MKRLLLILFILAGSCHADARNYFRLGQAADVQTSPTPGFALMGGGSDIDAAFKFLCERANGGDFLILRARGDGEYNPYVNGLCKLNSVSTLVIPDKATANDPTTAEIIHNAEAIFIAGGDQARYINFWTGTPVQRELNAAISRGVPIGGTSAGLAVLGSYVYSSQNDAPDDPNLGSHETLMDPFNTRITLRRDFVTIPLLRNTITDTHFKKRDRLGRTLVFLARIVQDGWSSQPRAIGVDEKAAVLVEADGKGTVVGSSNAYFFQVNTAPQVCQPKKPLTFQNISVYRVTVGNHFDLSTWTSNSGEAYTLTVDNGVIHSSRADGSNY